MTQFDPFALNITPQARGRIIESMEHQHGLNRLDAADRIVERLEDMIAAVDAAKDDPTCKDLRDYINGAGQLTIGMQRDVNDLLEEFDPRPLATQPADEVRFVEATAQYFGAKK